VEQTLYDSYGKPVAYIADDQWKSIYLWRGHAVAYLQDEKIYGWNGKHLGWLVDGILYDLAGRRTGFLRERCPVVVHAAPAKYAKYGKYAKYARHAAYARAARSTAISPQSLEDFLKVGAVGSV